MSKAEIIEELPKLTAQEREEIRRKLDEFENDTLTPEEWAIVDVRIAEHAAHPQTATPWEEFKVRLEDKYQL